MIFTLTNCGTTNCMAILKRDHFLVNCNQTKMQDQASTQYLRDKILTMRRRSTSKVSHQKYTEHHHQLIYSNSNTSSRLSIAKKNSMLRLRQCLIRTMDTQSFRSFCICLKYMKRFSASLIHNCLKMNLIILKNMLKMGY